MRLRKNARKAAAALKQSAPKERAAKKDRVENANKKQKIVSK